MRIHDWTRVEPGIFHSFHVGWIYEIQRALNAGILPADYYALAEQESGPFVPDVLPLQSLNGDSLSTADGTASEAQPSQALVIEAPRVSYAAETELAHLRSRQRVVTVRHTSDDRVVAVLEILSKANKSSKERLKRFVEKAASLLEHGIHLLRIDLYPPSNRDPNGIHSALWEYLSGDDSFQLSQKPLTLAAYECREQSVCAYVEP